MKTLKETFVIVRQFGELYEIFQNFVSFDKAELDAKCETLNKDINDFFKKNSKLKDYTPVEVFIVCNLEEAIDLFKDQIQPDYQSY